MRRLGLAMAIVGSWLRLIFIERLKLQNMNKNYCLARHIMDSSWGTFKGMLRYKANRLVEVEPHNTSIECSKCGNLVPKTLAIRIRSSSISCRRD